MKNLKPKVRSKGFKNENIFIKNDNELKIRIDEKIIKIKKNLSYLNLSKEDNEVIKNILKQKSIINNKEEFFLTGHELLEFLRISDNKVHRYLIYRYKYNLYPKKKIVGDYPPCIQIEPTSVCNYRCIMCYQADKSFSSKSQGFMGNMEFEMFKNAIDELEGNVEAITFASRGEPTLNKYFADMLKYCEGKFLGLKMNTNASMLNEKLIHNILSSDIQTVVFSIDSKDKESYEKIRINGKFEKILKNLELFNNIRNSQYSRNKQIIRISGVKINSEQNIEEMKKQWGDIADVIAFTNYTPWESSYENEINEITEPCSELWLRMFLWYDGKVNPCDYDYKSKLSKFSFKNSTIKEIWNSEYYNLLRAKHLDGNRKTLEPCARCINS